MVVLPEPDSPISASTSPRATVKLTSLTISTEEPSSLRALTHRPLTLTSGSPGGIPGAVVLPRNWSNCITGLLLGSALAAQVIDQQVHTDGQRGNGQRRHDHRQRALAQSGNVFPHQRAPVGVRRLHTQAQE